MLELNRFRFRVEELQQLEAVTLLFDQEQTVPSRLFRRHHMRAHANLALSGTTPSCEVKKRAVLVTVAAPPEWLRQTYPIFGPPCVKSKTWRGFKSHWNFWRSFAPWFPPLFGLMKTSTGVRFGVGIGFITKVLSSFSFDFFLPAGFFLGVFLNDDLKLPFRGSLTIHDGGTIIREWTPVGYAQLRSSLRLSH